ncbi:SusC/RagA family TonB-linked outer membrane protein [Botryobacter ruber]|uniref:SusC/RagA family TonB-linked outer membrane protein n=1 Tax=Botryobacter ruber TaxID=2171629 RepID=UPI000E0A3DA8|nr:SusC/RagA family TonB-linked outer membrane protein [Botryobacter ruber]
MKQLLSKELKYLLVLPFLLLTITTALAQALEVRGKITDDKGVGMPGVTVLQKGTSNGTITDTDGSFRLSVTDGNAVLLVSYVGYQNQEIPVNRRSAINVSLKTDAQALEEVVVVGYGTAKVKDVTGSVARVGAKDFNTGINAAPEQLIQGKIAGVNIVNNSGAPGGEVTFRIRGTSSVRSGNQPLFVVDGVPLDGRNTKPSATAGELGGTAGSNPLNFLNPNDIATIDVLKDASATAIYGARGANGVVIITTKKGSQGAPTVSLDMSTGISTLTRKPDIMDGNTFRQALAHRQIENRDGGQSVDAFDAIMRTAHTQMVNASLSGGNDRSSYRISLGYHDQEGIIKESGLKKYTGNYSGTYKFLPEDRLKVDLNLVVANTVENGAPIAENSNVNGSLIGNAIEWNPTVPFRDADGKFVQRTYGTSVAGLPTNPVALLEYYNDVANVTNVLGSAAATFNIVKGLDYRASLGINQSKGNRIVDVSGNLFLSTITDIGLAVVNNATLTSSTLTHTLNYNSKLSDNINLDVLGGYEYQTYKSNTFDITARGFTSFDLKGTDILQNARTDQVRISSYKDPTNELQSYFGRANLNIAEKYLLTATMRADGSTKFGENNKYGYFPSFAAAWIMSEEDFLKGIEKLSMLKLRAGWGQTGNQEFPAGASQERYAFGLQSIALSNVANPNLKWETTETVNLGLDFGLFKNRITGTVEFFDKSTRDLLFRLPALQPAPAASYWTNLPATVKNTGVEVLLNSILVENANWTWEFGVNATYLQNKLIGYEGAPVLTGQINGNGLGGGSNSQQLADGQPLFAFKMLEFMGFDEQGKATYSDEQKFVGDPNPNYLLGINTNVSRGKFSFSMNMNGAFGHHLYNNTANALITAANFGLGRNASSEIGLGNESLSNANVVSTRFLESGNFMRLQNATLGYTFGNITPVLKNARIYLAGQNLLLLTNYSGFDPEVNTNRSVNGVPSFGIEYTPYPMARSFTLGLNASF